MTESIRRIAEDDNDRSESNAYSPPPPAARQPGQLIDLWLDGADEPVRVRVTNRERIHFEKTQQKRKWPAAKDAQNLAMTFVCWSAATRAGLTTATYEQFEEALIDYDVVADEPSDPTR